MVGVEHNEAAAHSLRVGSALLVNRHELIITASLQHLIRHHTPEIARSIVLEQGKTFADAQGDVQRGLQVRFYLLMIGKAKH